MEKIQIKFAERLKELRTSKSLTKADLADKACVSQSAISRWENGSRTPSAEVIVTLAKFFDTTADYLLGLTDFE